MITISLCMIVKNEERLLSRCLDSVADLMDEIVIVDTGSTDRTKEIAARYTEHIYDFPWVGDFSAARNFAFSKATKEYIYSADADEVLDTVNRERFRLLKEVCDPEVELVQMQYVHLTETRTVYNFSKEYRPKLFRRLRSFVWIDPIHETIREKPLVFDSDIEVLHMPEDADASHAKRDLQAFEREIQKSGTLSKRLHRLYARELLLSGDTEACLRARAYFEAFAEKDLSAEFSTGRDGAKKTDASEEYTDDLKIAFALLLRIYRLSGDERAFYMRAVKAAAFGLCAEACMELGGFYEETGELSEAALWYYNAAYETESLLDVHAHGDAALDRLAVCSKVLGDAETARSYEEKRDAWRKEFTCLGN